MFTHNLRWRLKRIPYLARRLASSVAQRGWRGTVARIAQEFERRPPTDTSLPLQTGDDGAPIALPTSPNPLVSIIIPIHGKIAYTLACLRSIAHHGASVAFEVIVVDDASPDDSVEQLAGIEGLRLLRQEGNLGFIRTCNTGSAQALGTHLLFLNNDTLVTAGWLDRLLDCFTEETRCGLAGSRLVYPDGRLQEAGGLVYSDASAWNVGRFEGRDNPRFLYRRDVDYVSGAAMMIPADLFRRLGGFDTRYAPAYCEDMDLAFAVRAAGHRVIYQPESLVVHCEGISSGIDPFAGIKQYQSINREKFAKKWQEALAAQPRPGTPVEQAIHHRSSRHILIIDALAPDPTRDSGSLRLMNIMRLLHEDDWRITFMADNRRASAAEVTLLGRLGVEVLCKPWSPELGPWMKQHAQALDAVMLCRHYVAEPHMPVVRRLAPRARVLFDTVDLHFLREQRAAEHGGSTAMKKQALASQKRELALIKAADTTFVVSPVELEMLGRLVPEARVELLSNVHEVFGRAGDLRQRRGLVFVGGFGHPPNIDAVRWLVDEIFPRVRAARDDIFLHLIGHMPEPARAELARPGVTIHGRVEDLSPWMSTCRVALAPLRYGAGVKGKVNMAMSHGLPVVATSIAMEGMHLTHGQDVLVADNADAFVVAILRLHDDDALWLKLSDGGLANVRSHFSFDAARQALRRTLD